jgi:hypothetical protein
LVKAKVEKFFLCTVNGGNNNKQLIFVQHHKAHPSLSSNFALTNRKRVVSLQKENIN